jgi:hypothetical protein
MESSKRSARSTRRGRPPKFGRPAQLITLTLPDDVVAWLKALHPDPAWAVVKLFERFRVRTKRASEQPVAELVQLPGRRALIVVRPELFRGLAGVSLIPLQDGRAFLAFEGRGGLADLEVALLDKSERPETPPADRGHLLAIRARIKTWRQSGIRFQTRSIIVAERGPSSDVQPRPLSEIRRTG